jgi:hypothetical protein
MRDDQARDSSPGKAGGRKTALTIVGVLLLGVVVLAAIVYYSNVGEPNEPAAKLKIQTIEAALGTYKLKHGEYPSSLEPLTLSDDGKPPLLEDRDLIDPWGKPFQYSPEELSPTGKPKVFTTSPQGEVISNW